jgi:hypothetical protein
MQIKESDFEAISAANIQPSSHPIQQTSGFSLIQQLLPWTNRSPMVLVHSKLEVDWIDSESEGIMQVCPSFDFSQLVIC